MTRVVGIDPDARGGIALCVDGRVQSVEPLRWSDPAANRAILSRLCTPGTVVYLESIPLIDGNGHVGMASRMRSYGALRERLAMLGARVVEVAPVTWQASLRLSARGEGRTAHKARMHAVAERLCAAPVTVQHSDAVLIAYYGGGMETSRGG